MKITGNVLVLPNFGYALEQPSSRMILDSEFERCIRVLAHIGTGCEYVVKHR